jgi:hypothetical protein
MWPVTFVLGCAASAAVPRRKYWYTQPHDSIVLCGHEFRRLEGPMNATLNEPGFLLS